jgi:hypothetical protein
MSPSIATTNAHLFFPNDSSEWRFELEVGVAAQDILKHGRVEDEIIPHVVDTIALSLESASTLHTVGSQNRANETVRRKSVPSGLLIKSKF